MSEICLALVADKRAVSNNMSAASLPSLLEAIGLAPKAISGHATIILIVNTQNSHARIVIKDIPTHRRVITYNATFASRRLLAAPDQIVVGIYNKKLGNMAHFGDVLNLDILVATTKRNKLLKQV
ncbi:hypothetical protein N9Y08_06755 [Paracoccaceae bacterium]|nr:hypothetical protein [Paracoccaceae bacterium]